MKNGHHNGHGTERAVGSGARMGRRAVAHPLTWDDLCRDPRFRDLPYKVELNARGQILMSPTSNFHGSFAFRIGNLLDELLPEGEVIVECAVNTADGVKEADVAWASRRRWAIIRAQTSSSIAPEICAEVMSDSNTRDEMMGKKDLYLQAGAREYWLCHESGRMEFFDANRQLPRSKMCPNFPARLKKS